MDGGEARGNMEKEKREDWEREQREDRDREKRERDKMGLRWQFEEEEEEHHHFPLLVVQLPQGTLVLLLIHEFPLDSAVKHCSSEILVSSGLVKGLARETSEKYWFGELGSGCGKMAKTTW